MNSSIINFITILNNLYNDKFKLIDIDETQYELRIEDEWLTLHDLKTDKKSWKDINLGFEIQFRNKIFFLDKDTLIVAWNSSFTIYTNIIKNDIYTKLYMKTII